MHDSSYKEMEAFALTLDASQPLKILDVGSMDINGCYRPLFRRPERPLWSYFGADLSKGPNVDIVLSEPYCWPQVGDRSFDVVVSGQVLEHVERPWRWIREVFRALKPGGLACIIAPHTWEFHAFPTDCWRVWPDGMKGLLEDAGFGGILIHMNASDTVGRGRRPR